MDFYKIHILRQKIRLNVHVKLIFISTNLPKLQKIKETLNIPGCPCANVPAADVKIFSILSKLSAPRPSGCGPGQYHNIHRDIQRTGKAPFYSPLLQLTRETRGSPLSQLGTNRILQGPRQDELGV